MGPFNIRQFYIYFTVLSGANLYLIIEENTTFVTQGIMVEVNQGSGATWLMDYYLASE